MTLPRRHGTYVGHQGNSNPSRDDAGVHKLVGHNRNLSNKEVWLHYLRSFTFEGGERWAEEQLFCDLKWESTIETDKEIYVTLSGNSNEVAIVDLFGAREDHMTSWHSPNQMTGIDNYELPPTELHECGYAWTLACCYPIITDLWDGEGTQFPFPLVYL